VGGGPRAIRTGKFDLQLSCEHGRFKPRRLRRKVRLPRRYSRDPGTS
jgi:hypothetical protein